MTNNEFQLGDCVKTKYGDNSPIMNVNEIKRIPITNRIEIWCKWFNSKEQKWEYESFSPDVLILCTNS